LCLTQLLRPFSKRSLALRKWSHGRTIFRAELQQGAHRRLELGQTQLAQLIAGCSVGRSRQTRAGSDTTCTTYRRAASADRSDLQVVQVVPDPALGPAQVVPELSARDERRSSRQPALDNRARDERRMTQLSATEPHRQARAGSDTTCTTYRRVRRRQIAATTKLYKLCLTQLLCRCE
jgi:hypothetical protein